MHSGPHISRAFVSEVPHLGCVPATRSVGGGPGDEVGGGGAAVGGALVGGAMVGGAFVGGLGVGAGGEVGGGGAEVGAPEQFDWQHSPQ